MFALVMLRVRVAWREFFTTVLFSKAEAVNSKPTRRISVPESCDDTHVVDERILSIKNKVYYIRP